MGCNLARCKALPFAPIRFEGVTKEPDLIERSKLRGTRGDSVGETGWPTYELDVVALDDGSIVVGVTHVGSLVLGCQS